MAGAISGLHVFAADTGPEPLSLLDNNFTPLAAGLNALNNFDNYYVDSGSAGALIITVSTPQTVAYQDGLMLQVKVAATTTGSGATINVSGLGAKTITNPDGSALVAGQLVATSIIQLQYSATAGTFLLTGGAAFVSPSLKVGPPASGTALTVTAAASNVAISIVAAAGQYGEVINGSVGNIAGLELLANGNSAGAGFGIFQNSDNTCIVSSQASNNLRLQTNGTDRFILTGAGALQGLGPVAGAMVDMTPDTGTFTLTFVGFTTSPTPTCTWYRIGKLCMLFIPAATAASNSTTWTATGLPSAIQPATLTQWVAIPVAENNSALTTTTQVIVTAASGTLTFANGANTSGWTATGAKGLAQQVTLAYLLN